MYRNFLIQRRRMRNDMQKIHDNIVSSYFYDEFLKASEDDDTLSYHAKIYDIMTKQKMNAKLSLVRYV